ncbi:hypothetical protein [Streptomyces geranii]|uniref:hypothetical protein n=1 Tax=Streptomyces geranii TaxID=2058923 RepID=UPI00130070FC|nr:hypothetical protein [Streptomyces geranii]
MIALRLGGERHLTDHVDLGGLLVERAQSGERGQPGEVRAAFGVVGVTVEREAVRVSAAQQDVQHAEVRERAVVPALEGVQHREPVADARVVRLGAGVQDADRRPSVLCRDEVRGRRVLRGASTAEISA